MTYELSCIIFQGKIMRGLCVACYTKRRTAKKENEDLDWFDSLFAEPKRDDAA